MMGTGSPLPQLSVVTGGARSGKSGFAERLARLGAAPHHYIATAEAWDDEMRAASRATAQTGVRIGTRSRRRAIWPPRWGR
jgi:adenosyl cobinamide kinase/adenosyl cobinamide phosphate guanylyltransferase